MNTNAYYEIGSSHRVCEDYALSGIHEDMAYAIVSDGCSSSKDSDVGARLLSHIAKGILIYLKGRDLIGSASFQDIFRELVIRKSLEVKQSLGLSVDIFDATLLVSTVYGNKATCLGWGDGFFIFVTGDRHIVAHEAKFTTGAPYYISYEMSPSKKEAYQRQYGEGKIIVSNHVINPDMTVLTQDSELDLMYNCSIYKEAFASGFKFIALSSDGLSTYQDDPKYNRPEGEEKTEYKAENIIPLVTAYKSIAGEFVVRRMQRMKEDLEKNHVIHFDDISCATIALDYKPMKDTNG